MKAARSSRRLCWCRCDYCKCGSIGHGPAWGTQQTAGKRNIKHQSPSSREVPNLKPQTPNWRGKGRAGRFLNFGLGASLELGAWDLELFAWVDSLRCLPTGRRNSPVNPPDLAADRGND